MPQLINYPHVASMVFDTPLYTTRLALDSVKAVLVPRLLGKPLDNEELSFGNEDEDRELKRLSIVGKVAVIKVHGLLAARRGHITAACTELNSYERIRFQIQAAIKHELVEEIVLDFNTGGGMAIGCKELGDYIAQAKTIKPITAIINFSAYSAGYFLAAACSKIIVSQTSGVGSIGVILEHMEASKWEDEVGIKFTTFFRGGHKNDGSPHEPLTDGAIVEINKRIDKAYETFTTSVAEYRGMALADVIATEAKLYTADEAIALGLADEMMSPQEAINVIAAKHQPATVSGARIGMRAAAINFSCQL